MLRPAIRGLVLSERSGFVDACAAGPDEVKSIAAGTEMVTKENAADFGG